MSMTEDEDAVIIHKLKQNPEIPFTFVTKISKLLSSHSIHPSV
jgi:hypothetical protein